jgi:1-acyl-sn-glycerol-3-phosphate acyltransferase
MSVPAISKPVLWFFRRIVRGYFRRHFHAVRIAGAERFRGVAGPVIVYANHSSWWDPMVCVLLAAELKPNRRHYAPMDAAALEKYGILKRIGIFPVEMKSARGAVQFLRTGEAILNDGGVLWVTPQGRFCDPRERPLQFKPGMAALAARVASSRGECTLLPLAIEYPFWDERLPETLLYFGEAVRVTAGESAEGVQARAVEALEAAMEEMARRAVARRAEGFEVLAQGSLGAGGFYALGKRAKAWLMRRPYVPEHTPGTTPLGKMQEGMPK